MTPPSHPTALTARAAVAQLIDACHTLGADHSLVLHGGGNASIKAGFRDVTGAEIPALYVKTSGQDMATISADGIAPLDLERLRAIAHAGALTDHELPGELRRALLDPFAADPSIETLVHAVLPDPVVLHSHADAIVALTLTPDPERRLSELFGPDVLLIDYASPGTRLARAIEAACDLSRTDQTRALIVLGHGIFAMGDDVDQALATHDEIVSAAEQLLERQAPRPTSQATDPAAPDLGAIAQLRADLCETAGRALIMRRARGDELAAATTSPHFPDAFQRGPLTPDHVIYTRPLPLIGHDVREYAAWYETYYQQGAARVADCAPMDDPAPRVVLDPELGVFTAGRRAAEAERTADLYRHTVRAIEHAEALGGYRPIELAHIFDLEYWSAQRSKIERAAEPLPLLGRSALVTGAASGIGRACAAALLQAGATVTGWDLSDAVSSTFESPEWRGAALDVTDPDAQERELRSLIELNGGLDIVVVAAGIFPASAPLGTMPMSAWNKTLAVNASAVADLFGKVYPYLALAPGGGRVVVIASKNVPAPGPGAAAYSASKAALTQLSRVAALEWAPAGIRVNLIHPDAVFDTGLWTDELLAERAKRYGMSIEDYKRRNLLHAEVTSASVGRMTLAMVDGTFDFTTGAQVPIDGGNERVI